MIAESHKIKDNSLINLAYLGGLLTIWANHLSNPISKLDTFKRDRNNIEKAINKA